MTQHTVQQCAQKLVALIDAVERIGKQDVDLPFKIDNAKELARELKRESEFIANLR